MEDELDDKIIYQTYVSHMKIMSKIAWGIPLNSVSPLTYTSYIWRMFKMHILKPELIVFGTIIVLIFFYIQAVDIWSRNLLGRLQYTINRTTTLGRTKADKLSLFTTTDVEKASWQMKIGPVAAYAIQGRRPKMEDRFVINDNINNTGVALFAVFDGHGGEFAANYAKEKLINSLYNRVVEIKDLIAGKTPCSLNMENNNHVVDGGNIKDENNDESIITNTNKPPQPPKTPQEKRKSFRKTNSTTDECLRKDSTRSENEITDLELLNKLDNMPRPITRQVRPNRTPSTSFKKSPTTNYFDDKTGIVNYGKLLTDEVLAADYLLLEAAKKTMDVAGTTALIAILEQNKLIVANVGDSRGVMCDNRGNVIPLSFDHKPQQMRERKRIEKAGGFVSFTGVWRVAGILATSRALGDYPLKDKKLVIADPDILTFDLNDHKPMFIILASDGLWDTFSNEEAVNFIKERINDESDYGAKSLTLQSYYRGSLDNITVIIINFRDKKSSFSSSSSPPII